MPSCELSRVMVGPALDTRILARKTRHSSGNAAGRDAGAHADPTKLISFNERTDPRTVETLTSGLLAARLKAYAQQLHDQGYAVQATENL